MWKTFQKYLTIGHDSGIIDGQVILCPTSGYNSYIPYKTRDIPSGAAPKVIVYYDKIYVDTGKYDDGFRIYEENFSIYHHKGNQNV